MHRAEVASIAPDWLRDRDAELEELVEFCSKREPYLWWQAGPWAGKTALVATFAVDPPDGVRVASFFVTARLAGLADAAAFTSAMVRQLAEIAEIPLPAVQGAGLLVYLTTEAAQACARRGERLLMIVDGLDEDQGVKPSIASLLPRRPPDNLRVLVMSRPHPGIPGDVDGDHPLRTSRVRVLTAALTRSAPMVPAETERFVHAADFWALAPESPLTVQERMNLTKIVAAYDAGRGARLLTALLSDVLSGAQQSADFDALLSLVDTCATLLRGAPERPDDFVAALESVTSLTGTVLSPEDRPHLLAQIAAALLQVDRARAEQLATDAENTALRLPSGRPDSL